MAQFDAVLNVGRRRADYPFFLIVQSASLDRLPTRLVMPLSRPSARELRTSTLLLTIAGESYVMSPHDLFPAPLSILGPVEANVVEQGATIIQAIDDVITTAYG